MRTLPDWLRKRFSDTQRHFIVWVVTGLACGLAAVAFHMAIDWAFRSVWGIAGGLPRHWGLVFLCCCPALGGLLSGVITTWISPEAMGSGIPQTKARYYRQFGVFRLREAFWRFVAGVLAVGSGMSLGREGPTVHICAAIASRIGQAFGLAKVRVQAMVPLGMGAGIAAAFNTPMAAMFFVFEELLGDFSTKALFGILVAVVIAAIVERSILGEHAQFALDLPAFHTDWWMLLSIPLAILSAVAGTLFVKGLLASRQRFKDARGIPPFIRPAVGGLMTGILATTVFVFTDGHNGVFGIGYNDLSSALNGSLLLLAVLVPLFLGKYLATIISYSCGASGGLFAPSLFLGGLLGAIVGVLGQYLFHYDAPVVGALALLGMGCFFASVIRCPITSFMIIFEMTRNYTIMLPLMAGNIVAYMLSSRWQPVALYDSLLLQDKITLKRMPHFQGEQDWRNLPVKTIMTFEVVSVRSDLNAAQNLAVIGKNGNKHHAYPVLDANAMLVGMITHHEMEERKAAGRQERLDECLPKHPLITLSPETSIRDAARILVTEDVLQAPVVSPAAKGRMLGIVTLHDIARQQNAIEENMGR